MEITKNKILSILKKHINTGDIAIEPINKGVRSKVYKVRTERNNYILRYDTLVVSRYELEDWTMGKARKVGVLTPKAVYIGNYNLNKNTKINYVIQNEIQGEALSDNTPTNINKILEETGKSLKRLHSIKVPRFGHLTPKKVGSLRSWPEFLFAHFRSKNSDFLENVKFLKPKELDSITDLIISQLSKFNLKQGYMLHMDLSLDHIFYNQGKFVGLIDFHNVGVGDPLYDIATFEFYNDYRFPNENYTKPLMKGYGLKSTKEVNRNITYYKLLIAFWKITDRINSNRMDTVPMVKKLIKMYLKSLVV